MERPAALDASWRPVPLQVTVDEARGGRWTSLLAGDREWLWTNPDETIVEARQTVEPDRDFVDAGGVEECFPTVRGRPDHGAVWSRPWSGGTVEAAGLRLSRTITTDEIVEVNYAITAASDHPGPGLTLPEPVEGFIHAVHALLDLTPSARLIIADQPVMDILDDPEPGSTARRAWPDGTGSDLSVLGPDDGSAVCALLPECSAVLVIDGSDAMALEWSTDDPEAQSLCSLLLWRNLGGWPDAAPYRSIGIEPMIGRTATLESAAAAALVQLEPGRQFGWTLRLSAWHC